MSIARYTKIPKTKTGWSPTFALIVGILALTITSFGCGGGIHPLTPTDDLGTEISHQSEHQESGLKSNGVCIRAYIPGTSYGSGRAVFPGWNQVSLDYNIRLKDESTCNFKKATANTTNVYVDATYDRSGKVYKIPDHCTATFYTDGTISCCCHAVTALVKGFCRWGTADEFCKERPAF